MKYNKTLKKKLTRFYKSSTTKSEHLIELKF